MNPQKLAGQCAKLKCCLNFEVDTYAEAQKQLPGKDIVLETKDGSYYYFKPDILSRKITYSTDKNIPVNLVTIDARRAFEIIALNKQGIKVDSLEVAIDEEPAKEYGDIIGQDSLTRFDKSKKKKKKKKKGTDSPESSQPSPNHPQPSQNFTHQQSNQQPLRQSPSHPQQSRQQQPQRQPQPPRRKKTFRPQDHKEGGMGE